MTMTGGVLVVPQVVPDRRELDANGGERNLQKSLVSAC